MPNFLQTTGSVCFQCFSNTRECNSRPFERQVHEFCWAMLGHRKLKDLLAHRLLSHISPSRIETSSSGALLFLPCSIKEWRGGRVEEKNFEIPCLPILSSLPVSSSSSFFLHSFSFLSSFLPFLFLTFLSPFFEFRQRKVKNKESSSEIKLP